MRPGIGHKNTRHQRGRRVAAVRKPYKDAARALQGTAKDQIDFVATYRPELLAECVSETGGNIYIGRRALRAAVVQTYADLCRQSPKAMRVGKLEGQ